MIHHDVPDFFNTKFRVFIVEEFHVAVSNKNTPRISNSDISCAISRPTGFSEVLYDVMCHTKVYLSFETLRKRLSKR